jgi:hypothetical protein
MQAFLAQQRREAKNTDQVQAEQNHDHAAQSCNPVLVGLKDLANQCRTGAQQQEHQAETEDEEAGRHQYGAAGWSLAKIVQ